MADFYKILKADPLGEPWTPNIAGAKPIQNWWCQVEGQDNAVSIGKQVGNDLRPGMHVYGDLKYAKSQKGTVYWKFDSQKIPEDVQKPTDDPATPAQAAAQQATGADISGQMPGWAQTMFNMVEYIYGEMKKMDTDATPIVPDEPQTATEAAASEAKAELPASEPIDEETQATIDKIFTPETPEDITEPAPKKAKK